MALELFEHILRLGQAGEPFALATVVRVEKPISATPGDKALITEAGAPRATVITYVNPAVALALGVAFLGEPFTVGIAIGFVLIVLGSVLATRRAPPSTTVSLSEERARPIRSPQ